MKEKIYLFQNLLYIFEAIALLAGLISWRFIKDRNIRIFVIYLLFIVAGEQAGNLLGRGGYKTESAALYNYLVIPCEFIFGYWFISKNMGGRTWQRLFIVFTLLDIGTRTFEFFYLRNEKFFFSSLSYILSSMFLLVFILVFLWQFIRSEKIIKYYRYTVFWIAIAFLIYYLGSFPLYIFYNYLYKANKQYFYLYWEIQMYLNMLMYLLFGAGLLWTHLKYKPL